MKIEIRPSKDFVLVDGIVARVWRGTTETGTKCVVIVTRIAIDSKASPAEFKELIDLENTSVEVVMSIEHLSLEEPN